MDQGHHAYLLRSTYYFGWEAIAILVGASTPESANEGAKQYAQKKGEPWPVPDPWPDFAFALAGGGMKLVDIAREMKTSTTLAERMIRGQRRFFRRATRRFGKACFAYEVRALKGLSWNWIGRAIETDEKSISKQAREYAETHGLPWPPQMQEASQRYTKARAIGRLCYEARSEWHWQWKKIREVLLFSGSSGVFTAAEAYARRNNLPWPLEIPRQPKEDPSYARRKRAYELRRAGVGWTEIAQDVGYKNGPVAAKAVRDYTNVEKLMWPVEIERGQGQT